MGYDYSIVYKKGKENIVADALFRCLVQEAQLQTLTTITSDFLLRIQDSYKGHLHLEKLLAQLQADPLSNPVYMLQEGVLYRKGKIVVGFDPTLRK